ncbi:hypothetical protein HMN09_01132400 [Mycena chlorophos]|uniref:Uncharacterized protein n=1 Tax=Mycena chlorophos TaxID=658473 RepID=A0A8H6SCN0_MYCCL|nr:hypothetical protein HMN09_01132400 [Mycena chlorophos]
MAAYSLSRRGLSRNRPRQILLGITLLMLLAASAHLGMYLGYILLQLPTLAATYVNPQMILDRLSIAQTFMRRMVYFLSDIIVVWRAWVIWSNNTAMHVFLAVCLIATGASSLTLFIFNFESTFHGTHYPLNTQNFLGTFPLLVTNFAATVAIGWKLWYYRKNVKRYIGRSKDGHTQVESVLILLMESGAVYCVFWILLMVGDYGYYGGSFEFEWFQPYISALYPTTIILMVSREMTISEEVLSYGSTMSISFASGQSSRTMGLSESRTRSRSRGGRESAEREGSDEDGLSIGMQKPREIAGII